VTKDRLFEFLVLLGSLEYQLESFAEEMNKVLILKEMEKNIALN